MIKAEGGEVTFRGTKIDIIAEAVTVLHALKKELSEEEYKMVIRLADKSEEQVKDEAERMIEEAEKMREEAEKMREELKNLLRLQEVQHEY